MTALRSANKRGGSKPRPREWYIKAGREYVERYGELTAACLNPASAKRAGRPDLVERYYAGRSDGAAWPSLNAVKGVFGSFIAFRAELGLPPNSTGPVGGRRKAGEAEPIFDVRERRVVVDSSGTVWLRRQLEKARRRALRAEERLDQIQTRVALTPVETARTVELRQRLADERARRKEVRRELLNAERREARARAREDALRTGSKGETALLREVDRLGTRLAAAKARGTDARTEKVRVPITKTKTVVKTRTVKVQDASLLRTIETQERRISELRAELAKVTAHGAELAETLAGVRRNALAEARATERVQLVEARIREVEGRLAEQAELLVGERRQLTDEEVERLRVEGPAGPAVFVAAVKRVGRARAAGGGMAVRAALLDVISAALNWMERT